MKPELFRLLFALCILCSFAEALQGQNILQLKQEFWLQTANSHSPDVFHFEKKKLTVRTPSYLHYGCGYTSVYELNWLTDSTFTASFEMQLTKCNNGAGIKRQRSRKSNFNFEIDYFDHWVVRRHSNGTYDLIGSKPNGNLTNRSSGKIILVTTSNEK